METQSRGGKKYLGDVRRQQVGRVFEARDGAVTQTPGHSHQSVEVLQSSQLLQEEPSRGNIRTQSPPSCSGLRLLALFVYLSHEDELGEDLGSLLGRVSAEDHQLDPLGDPVAHHDRALQSRVVPDRTSHHVTAVVQELMETDRKY